MPDEPTTTGGSQTPPPAAPVTPPASEPTPPDDKPADSAKTYDEAYVKELRNENATRRKNEKALEARLAEIEAAQKQADDAKLTEQQKWQELAQRRETELAQMKAQLESERVERLRLTVATAYAARLPKVGDLDPVREFASRLRGSSEDELKADAEQLISLIAPVTPQESAPSQGQQNPARRQTTTAVPGGQPVGNKTDEDRRMERRNRTSPIFSEDGGVIHTTRRRDT